MYYLNDSRYSTTSTAANSTATYTYQDIISDITYTPGISGSPSSQQLYINDVFYHTPPDQGYGVAQQAQPQSGEDWAKAEEKRVFAAMKAEKLLKDHIGPERFDTLFKIGYLDLNSSKYSGRKYRVFKSAYDRIKVLENDKVMDELCVVPTVNCPENDRVLSKIVLLECDEDYILEKANHFKPAGINN